VEGRAGGGGRGRAARLDEYIGNTGVIYVYTSANAARLRIRKSERPRREESRARARARWGMPPREVSGRVKWRKRAKSGARAGRQGEMEGDYGPRWLDASLG